MKKIFVTIVFFLFLSSVCWASGNKDKKAQIQQQSTLESPFFSGNGGKGVSLTIIAPKANGLAEDQSYLPALVQREFVYNFKSFSAIDVLDYERLGDQYDALLSGYFDDNAGGNLGHLPETTHIMSGNITRTATGCVLQMNITRNTDKMTVASYSDTFSFAELDNLSGVRRASLELLQKMDIVLTERTRTELAGAAEANRVTAQTALAQGITAQRKGTEVAALSYYYQAAIFDPSMMEAANRSSILAANISSGNIGDNIRNDIRWRDDWVARLKETEEFLDNFNRTQSMPYTLFYVSNEIKQQGETNYQNRTATMGGIEAHLHGSSIWTLAIERTLQAVYDGLNATGRKDTWGLGSWPQRSVTNLNFAGRNQNFSVVFELLNDQNKVIGKQTIQPGGSWGLRWSDGRPTIGVSADDRRTVNFQNVSANDISTNMTIRVATVNGISAETAARSGVLQIRAITRKEFDMNARFKYTRGEIQGLADNSEIALVIPNTIWGDPVVSIADRSFMNAKLIRVILPDSITTIGEEAFANNRFTEVTFPNSVTHIAMGAFRDNDQLSHISIPDSVSIGKRAFNLRYDSHINRGRGYIVTMGANVVMNESFSFKVYLGNGTVSEDINSLETLYYEKGAGNYRFGTKDGRASGFIKWRYTP